MADLKISQLSAATTPLDGTETLPIVQGGSTRQVSVDNLTAGRDVSVRALTATDLITPAEIIGIKGTGTNNSAQAGSIGEYVSSYVTGLNQLATGTAENITSISLTAGDWDVDGTISFIPAATTSISAVTGSISPTTGAINDNALSAFQDYYAAIVPGGSTSIYKNTPTARISIASTTTIYLTVRAVFAISNLFANGNIRARRVR